MLLRGPVFMCMVTPVIYDFFILVKNFTGNFLDM